MNEEWQPIETAPKDGTRILVFTPGESWLSAAPKQHVAYWRTNEHYAFDEQPDGSYKKRLVTGFSGWAIGEQDYRIFWIYGVTHWKSLRGNP